MSAVWTLTVDGYDHVTLYHDAGGADGTNYCTFDSLDLVWLLQYDAPDDVWLLTNFDTEAVWFVAGSGWSCLSENLLPPVSEGDGNAIVEPVYDCSEVSYNCVDGTCVAVAGTGGTYPTEGECLAACGGSTPVVTACGTYPSTLVGRFTATTGYAAATFPATPVAFTWVGFPTNRWVWSAGTNCGAGANDLSVGCAGTDPFAMTLSSGAGNIGPIVGFVPGSASSGPTNLVYVVNGTFGCGASGYTLTLTDS